MYARSSYSTLRLEGDDRPEADVREEAERQVRRRASTEPFMFAGLPSALCGAQDDVVLWGPGTCHDWELELAVIIARAARNVSEDEAMAYVAGYTIANDISTRDVMNRPKFPMTDFLMSKCRPTFFPTGPYMVPREFVPDPRGLRIRLSVNGEVMQDESVDDIIYGVERLVAYASTVVTLPPGDLILTGSPAGNAGHHGNRWLQPGDVMMGQHHRPGHPAQPLRRGVRGAADHRAARRCSCRPAPCLARAYGRGDLGVGGEELWQRVGRAAAVLRPAAHPALGRHPKRTDEALCRVGAPAGAVHPVAVVDEPEVHLGALGNGELAQRFEVCVVIALDRDRDVDPFNRPRDAVDERGDELDDAARILGLAHVNVAEVTEAEVIAQLNVRRHRVGDAHEVVADRVRSTLAGIGIQPSNMRTSEQTSHWIASRSCGT